MTTAIAPEYFADYYSTLPLRHSGIVALVREDGVILARHPDLGGRPARLAPRTPILGQISASPLSGILTAVSPFDAVERIIAYRRLQRHGIYGVAGVETPTIVRDWMRAMLNHVFFGIPATITMVLLAWIALRHTRRESMAYERLHDEVAQRELAENALRQSQKMEAIGRLTGGIAHDFNNLLTAILGNVDLAVLRLGNANERVQRNLASAREASQRAVTLVNRLLSYSRLHPLEVKAVDVNRLVQGMSELLRRAIGEPISVETAFAGGLWKTTVDPNQLESAILNLAVNAKDAMPDGGRLTIETANAHLDEAYATTHGDGITAGQYVMLAVTDTGSGMSQEVVDHAFEPFFTTKPTGVGTGLGLSMVYGFIKQSGGHIKIYSEVGRGTSVRLYLPRNGGDQQQAAVRQRPPTSRGRERILVVEDDAQVRASILRQLASLGYAAAEAPGGTAALAALEAAPQPYDVLLTDVVMPGPLNGEALAAEAVRRWPMVKVVFMSGYT